MNDLGHVIVLAGGLSHERDVSLRSGRRITEALRAVGVDVELRDPDSDLVRVLQKERPGVVFPLLHGVQGEDGAIQEVLNLLDIPYVGSSAMACHMAFDKPAAKAVAEHAGIATPASVVLPQSTFRELGAQVLLSAILDRLGLPLVRVTSLGEGMRDAELAPLEIEDLLLRPTVQIDRKRLENFIRGKRVHRPELIDSTSRPWAMRPPCIVCPANSASTCREL